MAAFFSVWNLMSWGCGAEKKPRLKNTKDTKHHQVSPLRLQQELKWKDMRVWKTL